MPKYFGFMSYVSYTCLSSVYSSMRVSVLLSVFSAVLANKRVHYTELFQ